MKIIKVSAGGLEKTSLLLRQSVNSKGIWNDCKFIINDNKLKRCDWWFVLHGGGLVESENCLCDPDHVVYVSMEPSEKISQASDKFLEQFSHLVMCDRTIKHRNITYNNWLTWWVGMVVNAKKKKHVFHPEVRFNYDQLSDMQPVKKLNKISIILSNKVISEGHKKRIKFVKKISSLPISKYIDIYGHGSKPISDKWDAIAPYKYHLVLENSVQKDYWSEKLADTFLGFSFPIYYGCPNIYDYFSKDSLNVIDIDNIDQAVKILQNMIDGNTYNNSMQAIEISRNQVLNQYNIFNLMSELAIKNSLRHQNIKLNTNMFFKDSLIKKLARLVLSKFPH
jgi:hypothetical protein